MTGLRHSPGISWPALVFDEQANADSGIGFLVVRARDLPRTDVIMVRLVAHVTRRASSTS